MANLDAFTVTAPLGHDIAQFQLAMEEVLGVTSDNKIRQQVGCIKAYQEQTDGP
jgi:hypothetical protein